MKPPKNKYTPEQDVKLGREAAAEVRNQYPVIDDQRIVKYLAMLGDRLVTAAPAELKHPVYEYSFTPVNLKEINAFALPGGPMFVNRGMFDAAATEGEVVGVMAHELAHVLLRHGTANVSKAQNPWLQLGQIAGVVGGAVVGGAAGSAIAQSTQFGLGTLMLRYSRDYEKQADLLGAQIMARAGYDPRALARMFETIERETQIERRQRPAVDEQPPQSGQPHRVHHQRGGDVDDRRRRDQTRVCADQVRVCCPAGAEVDERLTGRAGGDAPRPLARPATCAAAVDAVQRPSPAARSSKRRYRRTGPAVVEKRRSRWCRKTATVSSTARRCSATASSSASPGPPRATCRRRPTRG